MQHSNNQNDAKTGLMICLSFVSASHQLRYFQNLVTIVYDISGLRINQSKASSLINMSQKRNFGLLILIYVLVLVILTLVLLVQFKIIPFVIPIVIAAGCFTSLFLICCFLTMKRVIKSLLRKAKLRVSDQEVESNFPFDTSET